MFIRKTNIAQLIIVYLISVSCLNEKDKERTSNVTAQQDSLSIEANLNKEIENLSNTSPNSKGFNKFKFSYLDFNNKTIDDSTKYKIRFYFNQLSLESLNQLLENPQKLNTGNAITQFLYTNLNVDKITPRHLKPDPNSTGYSYSYENKIDRSFYEGFSIEQIKYFSEVYYNSRIEFKNYLTNSFKDINKAITIHYKKDELLTFQKNELVLHFYLSNRSLTDIQSFKGKLFIVNKNLDKLLSVNFDSNIYPLNNGTFRSSNSKNVSLPATNYYNYFTPVPRVTVVDSHKFVVPINDYTENLIKKDIFNIQLIFVPTEIIYVTFAGDTAFTHTVSQ